MVRKTKDPIESEAKAMTNTELTRWAKLGEPGFKQVAAEQELSRRAFWRDFWSRGIVAWLALAISLISLAFSIIK